jgi:uncharacterized protein YodC (DUF2158 family)
MAETFVVGDEVQLKSGGAVMTIERIDHDDDVRCVWFEGKKVQRGTFVAATLRKPAPSAGFIPLVRG